jgi:hypothetical protein
MQVIQITNLTGHSPYNITICDITNTYCYSGVTGATTAPLTINVPTQLLGTKELLVVVTDSIGCQEIQYHSCGEFIPSQTPTTTPTPTPTKATCNCISIKNPSGVTLNFGFTQCDGTSFYGPIYSATTLYVCGRLPYGDSGLIINISSDICTGDVCPGPTPTPTTTPTPTPTLPPIVGYFRDVCDSSYEFTLSDIPGSFSPLSGIYFIESSEYAGCATSIVSTTSTNIFSYIAMGSQPSIPYCLKSNFSYPCPTLTPTPSMTPTHTPTFTPTQTPTHTPTYTPTSTSPVKYVLFQAQSCCFKKIIKFLMLPINFLPGTVIVNLYGECLEIIKISKKENWITDYWNGGTTYIDCDLCIKIQSCFITPTPTPTPVIVDCSSYLLFDGGTTISKCDINTGILTPLTFPNPLLIGDIANSYSRFWTTSQVAPYKLTEYTIVPSPFSAVYNKTLNYSFELNGLIAKDNTTLISTRLNSGTSSMVVEFNVLGGDGGNLTIIDKFLLPGIDRNLSGDLVYLPTTDKLFVSSAGSDGNWLTQFNYTTGVVEYDVNISSLIGPNFGLSSNAGDVYVYAYDGRVYRVDSMSVPIFTYIYTITSSVNAASSDPSCNILPTPTPTQTPTVTPTKTLNCVTWDWAIYGVATTSLEYYDCNNVFTSLPITSISSGSICVYPLTTPVWNPPPFVSNSLGTSGVICF